MKTTDFTLKGLTCEACVKLTTNRFKKIPGVAEVKIDLTSGRAQVLGEREFDLTELEKSLSGLDYSIVK